MKREAHLPPTSTILAHCRLGVNRRFRVVPRIQSRHLHGQYLHRGTPSPFVRIPPQGDVSCRAGRYPSRSPMPPSSPRNHAISAPESVSACFVASFWLHSTLYRTANSPSSWTVFLCSDPSERPPDSCSPHSGDRVCCWRFALWLPRRLMPNSVNTRSRPHGVWDPDASDDSVMIRRRVWLTAHFRMTRSRHRLEAPSTLPIAAAPSRDHSQG